VSEEITNSPSPRSEPTTPAAAPESAKPAEVSETPAATKEPGEISGSSTTSEPAGASEANPSAGSSSGGHAIATFGNGCFWCTEAVMERLDGVIEAKSGYMGGHVENPSYEEVCGKKTGHAEVVQVTYDPNKLSYEELLDIFWHSHDPTTKDRQGNDVGPQYRSVIFYHTPNQKAIAENSMTQENAAGKFGAPIVTEITEASAFWEAEDYHQDFFAKNPGNSYCRMAIPPKLRKLGLE
jgi:peptide-methionine (S)-S-oxide reductase